APTTRKGRLRVEIEERLKAAADKGTRVLIVRAGDYFGPSVRNGLVDRIFGNAARGKPMAVFGNTSAPHQWAYVPDLARLTVDLMELPWRGDGALKPFETVHFAGHIAIRQSEFLRQVASAAAHTGDVRVTPWWLMRLAGLVNPVVRELLE